MRQLGYPTIPRAIYKKLLHPFGNLRRGENIYQREWDLCIIVDACRYDLFEEVCEDYEWINSYEPTISVDSKTEAWVKKTFTNDGIATPQSTAYLSANPFSRVVPDESSFATFDAIWRDVWDEEVGTVPPRAVTDRAIEFGREQSVDRLPVHYLQPHIPFINWSDQSPIGKGNFGLDGESRRGAWAQLRDGEVTHEEVWGAYRDNLELVLNEVGLLLENIDVDRAVLTSDHGNAAGEWGLYGHPIHMPFNCLRQVPWAEVSAFDEQTHEPTSHSTTTTESPSVAEQLEALGYK